MIFSESVYREVKNNCLKNRDQESCGLIKGLSVIECENISPDPKNSFLINPLELIKFDPDCIYHSHINCSSEPSVLDLNCQKEINIPFLIYSLDGDDFYFLKK